MTTDIDESALLRRELEELKELVSSLLPRRGPLLSIDETAVVDPSCSLLTGTSSNRITIGRHTKVFRGAEWLGTISVGERVFINAYSFIRPNVVIEDDVSIGQHVRLVSDTHEISTGSRRTGTPRHDPIRVGAGTWIGAGVTVLGGATIGERCIIAAGAVVTGNIPANSVAAGVPARVIRHIDDVDGQAVLRIPKDRSEAGSRQAGHGWKARTGVSPRPVPRMPGPLRKRATLAAFLPHGEDARI